MNAKAPGSPSGPVFHEASQNLYRLESSEIYYALFERGGKQILKSFAVTSGRFAAQ
jgi:hypothetical protein